MLPHPGHPTTEARPPTVAAQRTTNDGPLRLHGGDARPLVEFAVLNVVDLLHEHRRCRPRLHPRFVRLRVDQRHARTVDAGNRLSRELRHLAQQIDHTLRARHDPGHPAEAGVQIDLVRFPLRGGKVGLLWRVATRLGVVVSHSRHQFTRHTPRFTRRTPRKLQPTSANAWARRSFPDGVFGIVPGCSTTTSWAPWCSMRRTSEWSCHAADSTATANVSRECPASMRTATAQPGRTPETRAAARSMSVG